MIVKMKKVSIVALAHDREKALHELREAGVLHIESEHHVSDRLNNLTERHNTLIRADRTLKNIQDGSKGVETEADLPPEGFAAPPAIPTADEIVETLSRLQDRESELIEERDRVQREIERIAPWGEFDPDDIRYLRDSGVPVGLYVLSKRELKAVSGDLRYVEVFSAGSQTGIVVFEDTEAELTEFRLPGEGIRTLRETLSRIDSQRATLGGNRRYLVQFSHIIEERIAELETEIEFEQARESVGIEGNLAYLTGFAPENRIPEIEELARRLSWGLLVREPEEEDNVPTLVKNPKPIAIIKPVFNLLGTIPGYREYDISFFFLLFFSLFFAMIIGDAGYGGVFLIGTVFSAVRTKRKGGSLALGQILLLVLSLATIVWGALTGTWFGSKALAETRFLGLFIYEPIATFNPRSSEAVIYFCFIVGAVQIMIAHLWNFISELRQKPRIRALAQLGWISMVSGIFYLVLNLVLDPDKYPLPKFALWLIIGGLSAVILFSQQEGNFFKGVLKGVSGLLTTFLDGISAFGDVISYIRLFAVGLATVEIAKSFNAMAADMGSSVVGIIGAVLILGLGHTLNLAMGALSVVVHGVRLNMLEFSGHLGMEWAGVEYHPFSRRDSAHDNT